MSFFISYLILLIFLIPKTKVLIQKNNSRDTATSLLIIVQLINNKLLTKECLVLVQEIYLN